VTPDEDVVANDGAAWSRSSADSTAAVERAVGSDSGFAVDSYRTTVTDDHAGANLGIRMKINEGHN